MSRLLVLGLMISTLTYPTSLSSAYEDLLEQLGERYKAQQAKYWQELQANESLEQRIFVLPNSDPRNMFLEEFLRIEARHRGQPQAISALYHVLRNAAGIGNPEMIASLGRVKAICTLRDHYLEHSDLDLLLSFFETGSFVPEAELLLRDAVQSPHEAVRAAARFYLARFLIYKVELAETIERESDEPAQMAEYRRQLREQISRLQPLDFDAERANAKHFLDQLLEDGAHHYQIFVQADGPGGMYIRRKRTDEMAEAPRTYGSLATALLYELAHLQVGDTAPGISGIDANGERFELSDYRGRVVLLMFSAEWCGPCKRMYPEIRKLQTALKEEPFTVLAVMGDQAPESVIRDVNRGDIRWRTWFDGEDGLIATRWNVSRWPTIYLIDHNGVIVDRRPGRSFAELKSSVGAAIATMKARYPLHTSSDDSFASREPTGKQDAGGDGELVKLDFELDSGIGRVRAAATDNDEQILVLGGHRSAGANDEWKQGKLPGAISVWDIVARKKIEELGGSFGAVCAIDISSDGRLLITAGRAFDHPRRGHLMLWDLQTRKLLRSLGDHSQWVLGVAFSPDGSLVASGGFDKCPSIWKTADGSVLKKLPLQPSYVDHLLFTPDGRQLIVPSRKGNISIFDTQSWELQKTLQVDNLFLLAAALSANGRFLAVGGSLQASANRDTAQTGQVTVWDLEVTSTPVKFSLIDLVNSLSFSPDGQFVAARGPRPEVTFWKWAENEVYTFVPDTNRAGGSDVWFWPKTSNLLINAGRGRIQVYDWQP